MRGHRSRFHSVALACLLGAAGALSFTLVDGGGPALSEPMRSGSAASVGPGHTPGWGEAAESHGGPIGARTPEAQRDGTGGRPSHREPGSWRVPVSGTSRARDGHVLPWASSAGVGLLGLPGSPANAPPDR